MSFGPFRPVVVQRAGWYFKPVRLTLTRSRLLTDPRRQPMLRIYSNPNASSSPPSAGAASFDGDFVT
jgi:hypothetical protein